MMARHAELIVDQPWFLLWPCLIPWIMFEAIMGYAWLHNVHRELLARPLSHVSYLSASFRMSNRALFKMKVS